METVPRRTNPIHPFLDPAYVTGFIEGEGSFTYSRNGGSFNLYFSVKLTAADYPILLDIQRFFGVGTIYDVKARGPRLNSGNTKAAKLFRINRARDLQKVVTHFDQYSLRGTKDDSYRVWRAMVMEKSVPRKASLEKLELLARELSSQSPRNQEWIP